MPVKFYIIFITLISYSSSYAQQLFIPLEFQSAYEDNTRSPDGKPGIDYWQNHADYKIKVNINTETGILSGSEDIIYYNQSPDTLDKLVLRLYPNIFKKDAMRDFPYKSAEDQYGLKISQLNAGKKSYNAETDTSLEYTGTNLIIKDIIILPGKQINLKLSWDFKIPGEEGIRMGRYKPDVFFVAYWYPQISVYDDIDGWDLTEYTGNAEFYNDFNNYDVNITVPNNLGVWATGDFLNPPEVLSQKILLKYNEALNSDSLVNIISMQDLTADMPLFSSLAETNTWHFSSKNIPDFTFGIAAHYLWDGKTADGGGGKKVFVNTVYDQTSIGFIEICDLAVRSVEMLSKELPGIPYPYSKITLFNGRGGMESPMMENLSAGNQRIWNVYNTVHEVTHSYFPFYMGINERKYAWMDEGWSQMLSEYIQYELDKTIDFRERNVNRYLDYSGQFDEIPMMYPSYMIRGEMYINHAFFRPANAYNILKDFMGDISFKKSLQEFIKRWNGKHPSPYDFFYTFEDVTDDELGWFFEPWFFKHGYPDLAIDTAFVKDDALKIQITKEGDLPIPVALTVKYKDGSVKQAYRTASVWKNEDSDEIWIDFDSDIKPAYIELGSKYIPDADTTNNYWNFK
ncbi:MAG: M1 family metallopeptidase [Ignavibacteria bacterium]|nr:M1 family metallopeptidase [Ignavibacteria bacterium]